MQRCVKHESYSCCSAAVVGPAHSSCHPLRCYCLHHYADLWSVPSSFTPKEFESLDLNQYEFSYYPYWAHCLLFECIIRQQMCAMIVNPDKNSRTFFVKKKMKIKLFSDAHMNP